MEKGLQDEEDTPEIPDLSKLSPIELIVKRIIDSNLSL